MGMKTPAAPFVPMTPEQAAIYKWEKEIDDRNRPLSDEELDALMPPGYKVLSPPSGSLVLKSRMPIILSFYLNFQDMSQSVHLPENYWLLQPQWQAWKAL
jgi:hypothetical protein